MIAQLTSLAASGSPFYGAKKTDSSHGGFLRRVLGLRRRPKRQAKPAIQHPFAALTCCDGTIWEVCAGQAAKEYMSLPGIEVVRKVSLKELDTGQCEYCFELNAMPDLIWRWFFKKALREFEVRCEDRIMVMACLPSDLEWIYQTIKTSLLQANLWYAQEREQLIPRVIALDEERCAAREFEENRKIGIRRQFDCLEL